MEFVWKFDTFFCEWSISVSSRNLRAQEYPQSTRIFGSEKAYLSVAQLWHRLFGSEKYLLMYRPRRARFMNGIQGKGTKVMLEIKFTLRVSN
jgi:hypothetical protein